MFSNDYNENRALYEIMWKNTLEPGRLQMTILCMRIACWIPKATNTHSQYVIIIEFPLQQWLQERASKSRYAYIGDLAMNKDAVTSSEKLVTSRISTLRRQAYCLQK